MEHLLCGGPLDGTWVTLEADVHRLRVPGRLQGARLDPRRADLDRAPVLPVGTYERTDRQVLRWVGWRY